MIRWLIMLAAAASDPGATLPRGEADAPPFRTLAWRVLGTGGADMREGRIGSSGGPVASRRLATISLTEGGGSSGRPSLCMARIAADAPLCAAGDGVLAEDVPWFVASRAGRRGLEANETAFVVDPLQGLDAPDRLTGATATCDGAGVEWCPDARAAPARIDMLRPSRVDVRTCDAGRPGSRTCAYVEVERRGLAAVAGEYTFVTVDTDTPGVFAAGDRIRSIRLTRRSWVV